MKCNSMQFYIYGSFYLFSFFYQLTIETSTCLSKNVAIMSRLYFYATSLNPCIYRNRARNDQT